LAVTEDGQGVIGKVNVKIVDGEGDILINTNPFLEPDTQYSATIASLVASNITNIDVNNKNIIYDYEIGQAQVVGGNSASAMMTLLEIYTLENRTLPENVFVTGAILPDGKIGLVGSILEKGLAIPNNSLFLIPKTQSIFNFYTPIQDEKYINNIKVINTRYVLKQINLKRRR